MDYKIKLKNSDRYVLIDDITYEQIFNDLWFKEVNFLENLRVHSSGNVVFQKSYKDRLYKKGVKTTTIYLHKWIAEKFIGLRTKGKPFLVAVNGNKLDCRIKNLEYRSRSAVARAAKPTSKSGYRGVYQEGNSFRAMIYIDGKTHHIGTYKSAQAASRAYKKRVAQLAE